MANPAVTSRPIHSARYCCIFAIIGAAADNQAGNVISVITELPLSTTMVSGSGLPNSRESERRVLRDDRAGRVDGCKGRHAGSYWRCAPETRFTRQHAEALL